MKRLTIVSFALAFAVFTAPPASADLVYVTNSNNTIVRFSEDGIGSVFATTTSIPTGIAFDALGNVYVAYPLLNVVERFSPTGVDLGPFISTGLNVPECLAFDSGGNLYVTNLGNDTIRRYTATGFDLGTFASAGLNDPWGIGFDTTGNLYAANGATGNIQKFNQFGSGSFFASPGQFGLALDTAGNVYVATGSLEITKVTPAGISSVFATTSTDPFGLAFDSAGVLYVTYQSTNSIERFASNGTSLGTFASSGLSNPTFIATQVPEPSSVSIVLLGSLLCIRYRSRESERGREVSKSRFTD